MVKVLIEILETNMSVKVFYDGQCGLCSKEINYYKKIDKTNRIDWIDVTRDHQALAARGIRLADALLYLHAEDTNGSLKIGVDAFVLMWSHLPGWKVLAHVVKLPVVKTITQHIYQCFAHWRYKRINYCELDTIERK